MLPFAGIFFALLATGYCHWKLYGLKEPYITHHELPEEKWFDQKLDHYKPTDIRTWKQRYYVNSTFFNGSTDSPIFLMIGGEGEATAKWMIAGAWIEYAKNFGALCFQLEHRFYGKSRPTVDLSVESLTFLNSEQALADLSYFIISMNAQYNLNGNKWVAFGGSYPGSLAAWLRYKYPHLVHAAISSSGPLLAKADFKEYNEVVKSSLSTSSSECVANIKLAVKHLTKLSSDKTGASIINELFKLCSPFNVTNKLDQGSLAMSLADNIVGVVQYNKDNRMTDDPTSKVTIDDLCAVMTNSSLGEPIERYAEINNLMLKLTNQSCFKFTYDDMIEEMSNVTWSNSATEADRQWTYQTCVEFGFYQTSSTDSELFGRMFPLDLFIQTCKDAYGKSFDLNLLEQGINRTNTMYGDLHLKVKRVLFVHGSIDPWHALGMTTSKNPEAPSLFIKGTAHCADMYPSRESDPPQLKDARKAIMHFLRYWLRQNDF